MPRHPVYALDTTSIAVPGQKFRVSVVRRNIYWSDEAVVRARPELFSTEDPELTRLAGWESPVEQATAGPGEKRATRRAS
jgi:hypothetical protein